jgi:hypothetical protein
MATTLTEVKTSRDQTLREFRVEVGLYAAAHPDVPFRQVAQLFQCSQATVSQAARSIGLMPRTRGRKQQQQVPAVEAE